MKAKHVYIYLVGVVCIGCFSFSNLNAQKIATKALGYPVNINPPKDNFQTEASYQSYIGAGLRDSKLDGKRPWIVFSDRADNPTFSSPDGLSVKTRLSFGDACIVISQNQDMIEIIKGRSSGLQIVEQTEYLGWIRKDKMLLWQEALVNANTGINQKAFLLNKAKEYQAVFDQNDKNRVPIYNSPTTGDEVQPSSIYRYFFVFKKENNRYLLAQEYRIYPENVQIRLIGWVPQSRCADWNTRLAYEPNNAKLAYEERKANPDFQVKAYDDRPSAVLHSSGIPSKSRVQWEKDPVIANSSLISEQNPYRYKGSIVRFPLLSSQTQMLDNVIATGIVGDITVKAEDGRLVATISEESYSDLKEYTQTNRSNSENVNVLYLVEGSADMGRYKDVIRNLFSTTKAVLSDYPNSNIGLVVYRGIEERPLKKDIEILSLNKNEAAFKRFVDSIQFTRFYNASEYSNLRYAIKEGINSAGFNSSQTNIIIVLGSSPDFASNKALREKAMLDNDPAVISTPDMVDILSKVNASIYFIQCNNDELGAGAMFKKTSDNILVELGKDQYSKTLEIARTTGITLKVPVLLDNAGYGVTELVHGALPGFTYLPKSNAAISNSEVAVTCTKALSSTAEFVSKFNQAKDRLVDEGKSLEEISHSAGEFSMPMAIWLTKFMQETNQGSDQIDIGSITKTKYQLFKEMFIPFSIKGAKYPALSYVLFMPASELDGYINKLKIVETAASESTDENRRAKLFDVFKELILQFSGNSGLTESDVQNMDYKQFTALMNGVKAEGLRLPEDQNFVVGKILDSRAMPMPEINKWITRLMTKLENLKKIYREGKNYPFAFSVGDEVYFWITLEESF